MSATNEDSTGQIFDIDSFLDTSYNSLPYYSASISEVQPLNYLTLQYEPLPMQAHMNGDTGQTPASATDSG
jgi:hypothetical protein